LPGYRGAFSHGSAHWHPDFGLLIDRTWRLLASPATLRRTNIVAGLLLILVGLVIAMVQ